MFTVQDGVVVSPVMNGSSDDQGDGINQDQETRDTSNLPSDRKIPSLPITTRIGRALDQNQYVVENLMKRLPKTMG